MVHKSTPAQFISTRRFWGCSYWISSALHPYFSRNKSSLLFFLIQGWFLFSHCRDLSLRDHRLLFLTPIKAPAQIHANKSCEIEIEANVLKKGSIRWEIILHSQASVWHNAASQWGSWQWISPLWLLHKHQCPLSPSLSFPLSFSDPLLSHTLINPDSIAYSSSVVFHPLLPWHSLEALSFFNIIFMLHGEVAAYRRALWFDGFLHKIFMFSPSRWVHQ